MRYLYGKLKAFSGEKINVSFSQSTRVLIMPERQFEKYRNNLTFTYFGGMKDSPYEFTIPKAGKWVVVVEKGTYHNPINLTASITKVAPDPIAIDTSTKKKKKKKKNKKEDEVVEETVMENAADEGSESESTTE